MIIIGITGGIGSGKSIVSNIMEVIGVPVYNSDTEAKRIVASSATIKNKLIQIFGKDLYVNNTLDKKRLATIIFNDPDSLSIVNSIIHPEVYKDFLLFKKKKSADKMIGIESAILFESKFNEFTDINISVSAPLDLRTERVMKRDNLNKENILNRVKNQISEEERNTLADFIIINDDIQPLIPQIENILSKLIFE